MNRPRDWHQGREGEEEDKEEDEEKVDEEENGDSNTGKYYYSTEALSTEPYTLRK